MKINASEISIFKQLTDFDTSMMFSTFNKKENFPYRKRLS